MSNTMQGFNAQDLLELTDCGIMVFSAQQTLLYANPSVCKILCIDHNLNPNDLLDTIINLDWLSLQNGIFSKSDCPVNSILNGSYCKKNIVGIRHRSCSKTAWVRFDTQILNNKCIAITFYDITDCVQQSLSLKMEQAASKSTTNPKYENHQRHFIREILDTLDVPIAVVSHPDQVYEIVNKNKCQTLSKIVGRPLEEKDIVGRTVKDVAPIIYEKGICDMALLAGYTNETVILENVEYVDAKGESTFQKLFLSPVLDENRNVTHIASVGIDLTEQILIQNKIKELSKAKEEFFSVVSHELRTPINVILSAEKVISSTFKAPSKDSVEKVRKWSVMIRQNSLRLLKLVNNILDLSKIDAGYLKAHKKNVNYISLVRNIYESIAPFVEQKGLKMCFNSTVKSLITAVDEEKIERIIFNLVSNAVKYNKEGGEIEIKLYRDRNHIYTSIRDTGIGIPQEKIGIIFERFLQVNSSLSRHREGAGIGLSLCKAIANLHGGDIYAESRLEEGSTFTLKLPIIKVTSNNIENGKVSNYSEIATIELSDIYDI